MNLTINGKDPFSVSCSREEISQAFRVLKEASRHLEQRTATKFYPGQKVFFFTKKGGGRKIVGTIVSVNRTTVTLREDENQFSRWKVSPSLLKVEPAAKTSSLKRTK